MGRTAPYTPTYNKLVDPARIELAPRQCECRVIPLYYGPIGPQVYYKEQLANVPSFYKSLICLERAIPLLRGGVIPLNYRPKGEDVNVPDLYKNYNFYQQIAIPLLRGHILPLYHRPDTEKKFFWQIHLRNPTTPYDKFFFW